MQNISLHFGGTELVVILDELKNEQLRRFLIKFEMKLEETKKTIHRAVYLEHGQGCDLFWFFLE